jgi:Xrn1 helical domain
VCVHQVGLLRDYLELEFQQPAEALGFTFELERVIDDFVLFCMLIGNDFLPCEALHNCLALSCTTCTSCCAAPHRGCADSYKAMPVLRMS